MHSSEDITVHFAESHDIVSTSKSINLDKQSLVSSKHVIHMVTFWPIDQHELFKHTVML